MSVDYRAYPILYVDDEKANLISVRYFLEDSLTLYTADSGDEALAILQQQDIAVLLCDQRMPRMSGVEVCEKAREIRPDTIRIIVTAYADMHAAIDAINRGQVTRYLAKPFQNEELESTLRTAIELVHIQRSVRDLEVRLLQSGPSTAVSAFQAEVAAEFGSFAELLSQCMESMTDLTAGAITHVRSDPDQTVHLLTELRTAQSDAMSAVEQMRSVVKRLERLTPGTKPSSRCDASRVVDQAVRILRPELQRVARLRVVSDDAPLVPIDATRLGQVVTNLLMHAAHAVAQVDDAVIDVLVSQEGLGAVIRISDNAPQLTEAEYERLFDPSFVVKGTPSAGFGLAIARNLVQECGGRVIARAVEDRGTAIEVTFPLFSAPALP
ncbi:MAG: response regulator [Myxococcota bacterium]